jgi:flagellar biosynthesis component FlhA
LRIDRAIPVEALRAAAAGGLTAMRQLEDVIASSATTGIRVRLGAGVYDRLRQSTQAVDGNTLDAHLTGLSDESFAMVGLDLDPLLTMRDHGLDSRQFRLQLNDLRWTPQDVSLDDVPAIILAIVGETRKFVGMNAPHLMTTATVSRLLDLLREREPALVDAVLGRFDQTVITWILRDLLEDPVTVRDFRNILEALASVEGLKSSANAMGDSATRADIEYWSNWIRSELTRQFMHPLMTGSTLVVHLAHPDLEARIETSGVNPLSDAERQALVREVLTAWQAHATGPMIILTKLELKRQLRRLIADELPNVRVLGYQELHPSANIVPRARIGAVM